MLAPAWHIVTGEYAPAQGGVAEYSRSVARGLAAAGDEVHVWAPRMARPLTTDPAVNVHPLRRGYTPHGLSALARAMRRERTPRRILLQYVPHAFGLNAMNVPFCAWIASLRNVQIWVMFHEVAVPWNTWWRWKQNVIAATTRLMATILASRADRTFVSIPSWEPMLRAIAPRCPVATWLPIPSNVPTRASASAVASARSRLPLRETGKVIGHFGTYGPLVTPPLKRTVLKLLKTEQQRIALLIGRGSEEFARDLLREPSMAGRIVATGAIEGPDVAAHLRASDVLVQPYPDGVSARRTSLMAGLALGVPTATNVGPATEPVWREWQAVELAPFGEDVAAAAEAVLGDAAYAAALAERGRQLYERRFSLDNTIRVLRGASPSGAS
jgi:glycosyltransferase involved in cell wall biosynthesis